MKFRWVLAVAAVVLLVVATIPQWPDIGRPWGTTAPAPGQPIGTACGDPKAKPANLDFTVKDMHGEDLNLADLKGKVILLDFWATWCGPCKLEIPGFVEIYSRYKDQGLVVLGLSVDDPIEKLQPFASEFRMNYPVLVGLDRNDVQDAYGPIWGIPTTFLISRDGKICHKHTGFATKEQFETEIKSLL